MNSLMPNEQTTAPATVDRQTAWLLPAVNIYEAPDGYLLEAEMPGVSKKQLEVTLENSELTITGHRDTAPLKADLVYRESKPASYRRVFEVDPSIDTERITAQMDQGLLILHLPIAERVKPRKITVS